jgi:hypothetical protein
MGTMGNIFDMAEGPKITVSKFTEHHYKKQKNTLQYDNKKCCILVDMC